MRTSPAKSELTPQALSASVITAVAPSWTVCRRSVESGPGCDAPTAITRTEQATPDEAYSRRNTMTPLDSADRSFSVTQDGVNRVTPSFSKVIRCQPVAGSLTPLIVTGRSSVLLLSPAKPPSADVKCVHSEAFGSACARILLVNPRPPVSSVTAIDMANAGRLPNLLSSRRRRRREKL